MQYVKDKADDDGNDDVEDDVIDNDDEVEKKMKGWNNYQDLAHTLFLPLSTCTFPSIPLILSF